MGCDIHGYIEFRKPGRQKWELAFQDTLGGRDYSLFAILAGVRGVPPKPLNGLEQAHWQAKGIPIFEFGVARGLPDDLSEHMKIQWNPEYYHNPSYGDLSVVKFWAWMDEQEKMREAGWMDEEHGPGTYDEEYGGIESMMQSSISMMEKLEAKGYETRLVFWFDS
jgi:hypothetical protein